MRGSTLALLLSAAACGTACTSTKTVGRADGAYEQCTSPELERVRGALARGDTTAAHPLLRRVVEDCPHYVPGHVLYQDAARELGGEAEAEMRAYYDGLSDVTDSPLVPFLKARLAPADSTRHDLLVEAMERDRSFYFAYQEMADLWRRIGRTGPALDMLEKAVEAKPDHPPANLGLAEVLEELGRGAEAAPYYENYVRLRPGDREAKESYVRLLLYTLGRSAEARPLIEDLLRDGPEDLDVLMDAAAVAWLESGWDRAAELYRRVLAIDPTQARAALNLGNLHYRSPDRSDEEKRRDWPVARLAYLYFLKLDQADDLHDLRDLLASVPYRLAKIDAFLGPPPEPLDPKPGDF